MTTARTDPTPLYALIEEKLAAAIFSGQFPPQSQLPTEDELIRQFGVSRITVRRAIQNLVSRGLIEIHRGRGTFVTQPKITQELTRLSGFVEDMHALGRTATARVIDDREVPADERVAERLAVAIGSPVIRIERVRLADGVAISFDETFLPAEIGQRIVAEDLASNPIFSLLEEKYGIPLTDAEYLLESVGAPSNIATALGIEPGAPIFLIERTSYTIGNQPVDYERLSYRGDLVRFATRLSRRPASGD